MRPIFLLLMLMAMCIAVIVIMLVINEIETRREKKRREHAFMCKKTVREGLCPHNCEKCAWGE